MKKLVNIMKRELSRIGPVTFWTLVAAGGNFFAGIVIARTLGPDGRGLVSIVISVSGLVSIAGALGTNVSFRTLWPQRLVNVAGYATTSIWLTGISIIPLIAVSLIVGHFIDPQLSSFAGTIAFVTFGISNLLWLQAKDALNGIGRIAYAAGVGAIGSFLLLLLVVISVLIDFSSATSVIWLYNLMNFIQLIMSWITLRSYSDHEAPRGERALLRSGPPFLGYIFGQELALKMSRPYLGAFSNSAEVGFFSVGAGLAEILRLPVLAVSQYILLDAANGKLKARGIAKRAAMWSIAVGIVISVLWPIAPYLLTFLYGAEYLPAVDSFRLLLLAQFFLIPFLIFSRGLIGLGGKWASTVPGILGFIILSATTPPLSIQLGATGAAISCILSYFVMSFSSGYLAFYLSRKNHAR